MITTGVINGRSIRLDDKPVLPDGTRVRINIETLTPAGDDEVLEAMRRAFGSCADDPTYAQAVAEIESERALDQPRDIDFDSAA